MAPLLTQPHMEAERLKMIEQALKDQAPRSYRELKAAGKLREFLKDHEQALMVSFDQAAAELKSRVLGPQGPQDYLETVQQLNMGENQLWEEALAAWLEFSDPEQESPATTASPATLRPLPTAKKDISSNTDLLTPSELASLRQKDAEAKQHASTFFRERLGNK